MTRGGKRANSGRKPTGTTYSEGYQAGYKAGMRKYQASEDAGEYGVTCIVCNESATEVTESREWFCKEHFPQAK